MLTIRFCFHLDPTPIDSRQLGSNRQCRTWHGRITRPLSAGLPSQTYEVRLLSTLKPYTDERLDALLREYAATKDKALVPQHAADHILAVVMTLHPRSGRGSPMGLRSADIMRAIVQQMLVFRWE